METVGNGINSNGNSEYLNINNLPEGIPVTRIAYVHDCKLGVSRFEDGYVTFFLKDCNANVINAVLFNVEDFMQSGVKVTAFKHKAVKFKCIMQEYRGRKSLVIDGKEGVSLYDGPFDYAAFVGKIDSDLTQFTDALNDAGIDCNTLDWSTTALSELGKGRCGAYSRFIELAFGTCAPVYNSLDLKDAVEFLNVFCVTAEYYFRYLKTRQATEIIGTLSVYELLSRISVRYADVAEKTLYLDALCAVVGSDKPHHLYAHLLKNAFDNARMTLTLQMHFESMPEMSKSYVGGVELSKY